MKIFLIFNGFLAHMSIGTLHYQCGNQILMVYYRWLISN